MSFAAIAAALAGKRPFYLYLLKRDGVEVRYTAGPEPLVATLPGVAGDTWQPRAVSHNRIPDTDQSFRSEVLITLPLTDEFAFDLLGRVEFTPVSVFIWRGFFNDPTNTVVPIFRGKVLSVQPREQGTISLSCMTDLAALQRKGLAAVLQRPCRHALYGRGCNLNIQDWQVSGEVLDVAGSAVQVDTAAGQPDGYYRGGVFTWQGRHTMILQHSGSLLGLASAVPDLAETWSEQSVSVLIAPGCTLSRSVCHERFNNIRNYGGFPWVSDNPFEGKQVF